MDSSDFRAEALQPILVEFECFVSLQTGTGNLTRLLASLIVIPLALHPPPLSVPNPPNLPSFSQRHYPPLPTSCAGV